MSMHVLGCFTSSWHGPIYWPLHVWLTKHCKYSSVDHMTTQSAPTVYILTLSTMMSRNKMATLFGVVLY